MASITRHGEKWRAQVCIDGHRASSTHRTKREAQLWALQQEQGLRSGPSERHTVADMLDRYAKTVTRHKVGAKKEAQRINAIIKDFPSLCGIRLSKVKTSDIAAWRDARLLQVKASSVLRAMTILRHAFRIAREEWGWMTHNPFIGLRLPAGGPPRTRMISLREIRLMCRTMDYRGGQPETSRQQAALAFLIALRTGMRAGEVLSLSTDTVNLERRVVTLRSHKTVKTVGTRRVPITRQAARLIARIPKGGFTIGAGSLDAAFRSARKAAMLQGFTFHDSRATALTWMARKVDVMTLSRISGHRDISILVNTYYRESAEDIAKRMSPVRTPTR